MERRIHNLDQALAATLERAQEARGESTRARARLGQPFQHEARLRQLRLRQRHIADQLLESAETEAPPGRLATPSPGPTGPAPHVNAEEVIDPAVAFARSVVRRSVPPRRPPPEIGLS
jgi:hypothetical protein